LLFLVSWGKRGARIAALEVVPAGDVRDRADADREAAVALADRLELTSVAGAVSK
jgi:hypothetical protein